MHRILGPLVLCAPLPDQAQNWYVPDHHPIAAEASLVGAESVVDAAHCVVEGGATGVGFDEFHVHLDVTGDLSPGNLIHIELVGAPSAWPAALVFSTGGLFDPPIPSPPYGDWSLASPILDPVWLPPISANGILDLPIWLDLGFPVPLELSSQALVGAVLTNPLQLRFE